MGEWINAAVILGIILFLGVRVYAVVHRRFNKLEEALDEVSRWRSQLRDELVKTARVPLQKVYSIGLYVGKRFWTDTLKVTPEELSELEAKGAPMGDMEAEDWERFPLGHLRVKIQSWFGGHDRIEVDISDATRRLVGPTTKWTIEQNPCEFEIAGTGTELMAYMLTKGGENVQLMLRSHELCWCTSNEQWAEFDESRFPDDVYMTVSLDDDLPQYAWPDDKDAPSPWRKPFKTTPFFRRYRYFDSEVGLGWTLYIQSTSVRLKVE